MSTKDPAQAIDTEMWLLQLGLSGANVGLRILGRATAYLQASADPERAEQYFAGGLGRLRSRYPHSKLEVMAVAKAINPSALELVKWQQFWAREIHQYEARQRAVVTKATGGK